jgi:hypothetical protein
LDVPKITALDRRWEQLMALCEKEATLARDGGHPRLLKLVSSQIDALAADMGFTTSRIATRDFRAERNGSHITRLVTD